MAGGKALLWKAWYRRWPRREAALPGYSVLLPVPGDLPVFLELALAVVRRQQARHRVETLVIPDLMTPLVREVVARASKDWPGELRLIELPRPDRWLPRLLKRPHANHWLQLINGVRHSQATHAVLHDADLFIDDPGFLDEQFEHCRDGRFACFGVNQVWDPWFAAHGRQIAATWELFFETDWLRGFAPHFHLGHENRLDGEAHVFDTTLYPQCLTAPARIGWRTPGSGLVHFNYVICTYRYFQAKGWAFEDEHFRVLLVAILARLFDPAGDGYAFGPVEEMSRGLRDERAQVLFRSPKTAANYAEFRRKFQDLLDGQLLNAEQKRLAADLLDPFDREFGWSEAERRPRS